MKTTHRTLCALLLLSSCSSSDQVNIGNTGLLGAQLSDYAGEWQGYAEAYSWHDGSDLVRLSLAADGSGHLQVGKPVAPETLAKLPFPGSDGELLKPNALPLAPGFTYPVYEARVETQRVQLSARSSDPYRTLCEAETPMLVPGLTPPTYNCRGATMTNLQQIVDAEGQPQWQCILGFSTDGLDYEEVPCEELFCVTMCSCSEQRCAPADDIKGIKLDGSLQDQGESLVGTLVVKGERVTVRLTRP